MGLSKLASVKTFETAQVEFFSQEQVAPAVSQGSVALLKGRLRLRMSLIRLTKITDHSLKGAPTADAGRFVAYISTNI